MRQLDNAAVSVERSDDLTRLIIEAQTGEQFLVELSAEKAAALAADLAPEPPAQPVVPQQPAPIAPSSPTTDHQE